MQYRAILKNWELKQILPGLLRISGDIYEDVTGKCKDGQAVSIHPILVTTENGKFVHTMSNTYRLDPPYVPKKPEQNNNKSKTPMSGVCEH